VLQWGALRAAYNGKLFHMGHMAREQQRKARWKQPFHPSALSPTSLGASDRRRYHTSGEWAKRVCLVTLQE